LCYLTNKCEATPVNEIEGRRRRRRRRRRSRREHGKG